MFKKPLLDTHNVFRMLTRSFRMLTRYFPSFGYSQEVFLFRMFSLFGCSQKFSLFRILTRSFSCASACRQAIKKILYETRSDWTLDCLVHFTADPSGHERKTEIEEANTRCDCPGNRTKCWIFAMRSCVLEPNCASFRVGSLV